MFKGYVEYNSTVCKDSTKKKYPCSCAECTYHISRVPNSQSGVEYVVENRAN